MTLFARGLKAAPIPIFPRGRTGSIPVMDSSSVILSDRTYADYAYLYKSQPWIHVCINAYTRGVSRLPLKAYQRDDGNGRERLRDGLLADLMRRPMGRGVSPFDWKSAILGNLYTYGNCIGVKVQAEPDAPATEIWPFGPIGWNVDPENGDYVYRSPNGGDPVRFRAWRIWHVQFWGPTTTGFGISPMEPLRRTLSTEDAAQRLSVASFANGVRPSGVLMSKTQLKDDAIKALAAGMKRLHSGVDNAFKPVVLSGDLSWLPMSSSLADSTLIEHRKLAREEVAAVFGLPQSSIGILDESNFASVDAFHVQLYQDAYGPTLAMLEESFAAAVLDGVPEYEGQYVEFDLGEVMRGDLPSRTTAYQRSLAWMTPAEIRERENLPPIDDPEAYRLHMPSGAAPDPAVTDGSQNTPGQSTRAIANGVVHA